MTTRADRATDPMTEDDDPLCLSTDAAAELLGAAPWRRFGVVGDSLSAGVGGVTPGYDPLPWSERVVRVLRRSQPDLAYVNLGVVGATTSQTLRTQAEPLLAFEPDLVHVPCGANDIWREDPSYSLIAERMAALFEVARSTGAVVTTFTLGRAFVVPDIEDFPERVQRVNAVTRAVAAQTGVTVVEMWDHPVMNRPRLVSQDGIHFAAMGQAVLAAEVVRSLAALLEASA